MRDEQDIKDGLIFDFSCFFGIVLVFRGFFVCLFFFVCFFFRQTATDQGSPPSLNIEGAILFDLTDAEKELPQQTDREDSQAQNILPRMKRKGF